MDSDLRKFPRIIFSEPVAFSHPEVPLNSGVAGNISLGGISLRVQGFVPMGTILELQVRLGQSPQVMWVKAKVVRIREVLSDECCEIGLKFIEDEKCIRAISMFIDECQNQNNKTGS